MNALRQICEIYEVQGYETQVLAASLRHPMHVIDAALAGADIATMPYDVFKKLADHPLTDKGLETFKRDWAGLQQELEAGGGSKQGSQKGANQGLNSSQRGRRRR